MSLGSKSLGYAWLLRMQEGLHTLTIYGFVKATTEGKKKHLKPSHRNLQDKCKHWFLYLSVVLPTFSARTNIWQLVDERRISSRKIPTSTWNPFQEKESKKMKNVRSNRVCWWQSCTQVRGCTWLPTWILHSFAPTVHPFFLINMYLWFIWRSKLRKEKEKETEKSSMHAGSLPRGLQWPRSQEPGASSASFMQVQKPGPSSVIFS